MKRYPETIEHRWDILYRDYPEIYDRFASFPYTPSLVEVVAHRFDLRGKVVVDNGSGTGRSTFGLVPHAGTVIGVEPEASMRAVAMERARTSRWKNVRFIEGRADAIPLPAGTADVVTGFTAPPHIPEAKRVLRRPGLIVLVDVAPGCYGGELNKLLAHSDPGLQRLSDFLVREHGFSYEDVETVQEYGTTENIVETYGFIFGHKAIEHLKRTGQTSIRWTFRMHYLFVGETH